MHKLNFPKYDFRFKKNTKDEVFIFDESRKKFILLTPEEWIRQNALHFLLKEKKYPISLIELERGVEVNKQMKRFDLICKNPDGTTKLLLECKAPGVKISQATFDQIIRYNNVLKAQFLWVTNGTEHYFFELNFENNVAVKINDLSLYSYEK